MNASEVTVRIGRRRSAAEPRRRPRLSGLAPDPAAASADLDDEDRVLGGQADEEQRPDLAIHVVGEAARPLRAERAKNGQRHAEQDDERQDQAFVLSGQREVHEQQSQTEDDEGLAARLALFERQTRPANPIPCGSVCAASRSISWSACPELVPARCRSVDRGGRNRLKWLMTCGAVVSFMRTTFSRGSMSPPVVRT